jgi:hypothetical protein
MTKTSLAAWVPDESKLTPMDTVIRAVMALLNDPTQSGQVVECSVEGLYYHDQPKYTNEEVAYLMSLDWRALITAHTRGAAK